MLVTFIFRSAIMILSFVECSGLNAIKDLSDWCSDGRRRYYHLTSGEGSSDQSVVVIDSKKKTSCSMTFSVKPGNHVMLVLEYPDLTRKEKVCYLDQSTSVTVRDYDAKETCKSKYTTEPYFKLVKENITVNFKITRNLNTIKMTATSMRDANGEECFLSNETECIVDNKVYCMTQETICNGHINCGVAEAYDEDKEKCKGPSMSFFAVVCSLVMVLITCGLIISISLCLVPNRKDPYVHSFDQSMSLFDCENGIVSAEINIVILFPPKNHKYISD